MKRPRSNEPATWPTAAFRGADVARSSDGLGWSGLRLEHRITPVGGEGDKPLAFEADLLIVHRRESRMWQEMNGAGREVTFRPGDALLLPRACSVRWRWSGPAETIVLAMPPTGATPIPHFSDWRLATLARRLKREMEMPDGGPLLADALALAVLARLRSGPAPASRDRPLDERRLRLATELIAVRPAAVPSIAELAAVTGLTSAHFARAFRSRRMPGLPHSGWNGRWTRCAGRQACARWRRWRRRSALPTRPT
jgi:hypothetical protein